MGKLFQLLCIIFISLVAVTGGDRASSGGLLSFRSSAENKMVFNLTILHHDLLLFAAHDAKMSSNHDRFRTFGVESYITYQEAHSYLQLHHILDKMCVKGGPVFRRVIFELDGYSCVGFLHEMFVAVSAAY
jgi:hypothetical protein